LEDLKVLVVDDEILIRKSVSKLLRREGLEVFEAEDGYKAIEISKTNDLDIIVTDIRMPGMSGIETIKAIKEINNNLKIIVMTGYASENTPIEAIRLGVSDYIYKPFELEEFMHCIRRNANIINLEKKNKRLEKENIRNQKLAAIGNMTNTIVHDVKNALTTVGGFAKLIKKSDLEQEKLNYFVDIIIQQTNIIMEKLKEILEFSKGDMGLSFSCEKIRDLFEEVKSDNSIVLEAEGVEFVAKLDPTFGEIEICTDKRRIKQMIYNLLSNSKDALDKEKKKIELYFKNEKKDYLTIIIKDNGCGIKKENLKKIFDPFETFDKKQGTGLGLAIVKQIVEKSDGTIDVKSEKGVGTEFRIQLPLDNR